LNIALIASNATVVNKTIATFELIGSADINFTMADFVFHLAFPQVTVSRARLLTHEIQIYDRDFNTFFDKLLTKIADDFNAKHAAGISIGQLVPEAAMVAGLLKNSLISPYVVDGWMQGGFSMYADRPFT
jgi:hypothetical protein